ncbi:CpsD/CapB family tyrosine-protein kinase [Longirhabdus pacifica]|uniref:CpsD/CapB family tyrosine-protein kinase n=1 Tax=Longirhabdus pacifica TaxID=2305227 RepID=UPI0013E8CF6B|nr:CpsD/CapB family tyrosine-protein kinase [Longirhabdus pacifica]
MPRLKHKDKIIAGLNPNSKIAEVFRLLRTNINVASLGQNMKTILIASSQAKEGRTTTLVNLAVTIANDNKKVLIIDADMRTPSIHKYFHVSHKKGLGDVLEGREKVEDITQPTFLTHVDLIAAGQHTNSPSELFSSYEFESLLHALQEKFDVILIDSPPILSNIDAQIISAKVNGVVMVVKRGKSKRTLVKKAKSHLENMHANLLGVVLNMEKKK